MSEAMGKVLGMAMAYAVSALGLFLAYVNYRRRIVKAERVMTGTAWAVVSATVLSLVVGGVVVSRLATTPTVTPTVPAVVETPAAPPPQRVAESQDRWPIVGIVVPALVFAFATGVTAALHRHFSKEVAEAHEEKQA